MRCGFCHSGKVKSAEQYGVNRQQCDSCNTITKQAELKLTETQQKIINYLSNWKPEVVTDSRDVTQDLDQDGIARAIGISRSNIPRFMSPLLDSNLVGQKKAHILDENNRTIGNMKRWVYYLTPSGKAAVTESFSAENSRYYRKNDVKYERNIEGMICNCGNTSGWIVSAFDGQNPPEGCYNRVYDISCPSCHENMVTYQSKQSPKSPFKIVYGEYGSQITPAHGAETFEATRGEMRQRRRTLFYDLPYEEESEDKDINKYARNNAGSVLWQATYQALRDEGRSHEQAETFCNTKFFDRFYEYIVEELRQPIRNLFNNLRKPSLGLTRKQRRENRIANEMFEKYFPDMASETFQAAETFEATRGEMRQRRRTLFYDLPYEEESEDKDINKYARNNAGSVLWQATYQALRDEGRSHEQAETFCNTKFFDRFYEYIVEELRQPIRNLFNNLRKPSLGLTRKQRRENRIANEMFEKYFPDMASETFQAEEPFICPECRRASTKSKTSQVCVRCESEYQAGRNAPMRVPWPGDEGYYAETFSSSVVDDSMTAESDSKSHVWINDNPRRYSFYRCGCGERMIYDDDKNYFECTDCRAIWDGKKYLGLDEVWNYCKNCGVNFDEVSEDEGCWRYNPSPGWGGRAESDSTPLSPTRPSSDDFSKPKNPRPRPRGRGREVPEPGPKEPSF